MIRITYLIVFFLLVFNYQYAFSQLVSSWVKTFDGYGYEYGYGNDIAYSAVQTSDGGFVVCGSSSPYYGNNSPDYWILKLSQGGDIEWSKKFGGSDADIPFSIQQTNDGGYIVAGFTKSNDSDVINYHGGFGDYWIIKLDENGNKVWAKCYGGSYEERANSIQQTNDEGYIITGYSESNDGDVSGNRGDEDFWTIKIDWEGNLEWQKCYGGSSFDIANSVQQIADGGYIIAGYSWSDDYDATGNHGHNDFLVVKTDSQGNKVWTKCYGGSDDDIATSIKQTQDGGYIVAGYTLSNDGDVVNRHYDTIKLYSEFSQTYYWKIFEEFWIVKLDTSGNIEWQKTYGESYKDEANSIWQCTDGGYFIVGYSNSNNGDVLMPIELGKIWIIKISSDGEILYQNRLGENKDAHAYSIQQTADEGCIIAGYLGNNKTYQDYLVAKLDNDLCSIPADGILVYPNPSDNFVYICINDFEYAELYDINGKKLLSTYKKLIDLYDYSYGMYILKIRDTKGKIYLQKIIHVYHTYFRW